MQPKVTDDTFTRIMHGHADWQVAIQRYERDKAEGAITWDEHGHLVVPSHTGCAVCEHIKAHTRSFQIAMCASAFH